MRANHRKCECAASLGTLYRGTAVTRCLSLHRNTRVTPSLFPQTRHMASNAAQGGRCSPCLVLSESAFFIGSRLIGAIVSSPWHSSTGPMAGLGLHILVAVPSNIQVRRLPQPVIQCVHNCDTNPLVCFNDFLTAHAPAVVSGQCERRACMRVFTAANAMPHAA